MTARLATRLLPLLVAAKALAADGTLPCDLGRRADRLVAGIDLSSAIPGDAEQTFENGLTNVVALHVALLPEGGGDPIALYFRELDVLYDVWEEHYEVTIRDPATPQGRRLEVKGWPELRALLSHARDLDLVSLSSMGDRSWVLRARLEVNPISKELLERTREFIANPTGGIRGSSPSRSVLGAMASYLLHGAAGGEVTRLESRPFTAREVVAR